MTMKVSYLILSGLLWAGLVHAQNMSIARDQARRAVAQTQAASGGQSAGQPAQSPPGTQQSTDPAMAATLQNIAGLHADFTAISAADDVTAVDQRGSLLNHLSAAAQGTKASAANIRKLATDLTNALTGRKKIPPQAQKLGGIVHALFNGARLSVTQQETLLNNAKKILTDAEVSAGDTDKIIEDLKAIAAETK